MHPSGHFSPYTIYLHDSATDWEMFGNHPVVIRGDALCPSLPTAGALQKEACKPNARCSSLVLLLHMATTCGHIIFHRCRTCRLQSRRKFFRLIKWTTPTTSVIFLCIAFHSYSRPSYSHGTPSMPSATPGTMLRQSVRRGLRRPGPPHGGDPSRNRGSQYLPGRVPLDDNPYKNHG